MVAVVIALVVVVVILMLLLQKFMPRQTQEAPVHTAERVYLTAEQAREVTESYPARMAQEELERRRRAALAQASYEERAREHARRHEEMRIKARPILSNAIQTEFSRSWEYKIRQAADRGNRQLKIIWDTPKTVWQNYYMEVWPPTEIVRDELQASLTAFFGLLGYQVSDVEADPGAGTSDPQFAYDAYATFRIEW